MPNNKLGARKDQDQLCLFQNCNLKSIKNYDFCYQHVDLFVKKTCQKYTVCKWKNNSKKCNQLVLSNQKILNENGQNEFCITHSAFSKFKQNQVLNQYEHDNKMIYWKDDDKNFNEIEHCLKNKQDADESGDEDITDNLIDIDSDPEFLNFSNDSSDQIMHQIIKQHSEAKISNNETNEENLKSKNLESVGLDLSKKTVYTKNELIKIYKLKLSKLKLMYRKQLRILNDKLIVDRKKYLDMIKSQDNINCSGNFSKTYGGYRSLNQIEAYIKEKYDPRCNAMSNSEIYRPKSTICHNMCIHKSSSRGNNSACNQIALPQSKFCQYHIGFDSNQFGFCNCSLIPEVENFGLKPPLIRDVIHKCDNNIEEKNQNFGKNASDFELVQEKVCIPEHLIEIHNKYLENIKKCEVNSNYENARNVVSDSNIDDNFPKKFDLKNEASEANTISKESESTASSSSDSSTSTTSNSNMSILSSSSSSTTDSGEESEAEKN